MKLSSSYFTYLCSHFCFLSYNRFIGNKNSIKYFFILFPTKNKNNTYRINVLKFSGK